MYKYIVSLYFLLGIGMSCVQAQDCKADLLAVNDLMLSSVKTNQVYYFKYKTTVNYRDSVLYPQQMITSEIATKGNILQMESADFSLYEDEEIGLTLLKQSKSAILTDARSKTKKASVVDSTWKAYRTMINQLESGYCQQVGSRKYMLMTPNVTKYPQLKNIKQVMYILNVPKNNMESIEIFYHEGDYLSVRYEFLAVDYNYKGWDLSKSVKSRFFDEKMRLKAAYNAYELRDARKSKTK